MTIWEDVFFEYVDSVKEYGAQWFGKGPDLSDFLASIHGYAAWEQAYYKDREAQKRTSGRPLEKQYDPRVEPMVYLVSRLYQANGADFDVQAQNTHRGSFQRALDGESNFFDFEKGKCWLNLLSALECEFHVFGGEPVCDFATFYARFCAQYANFKESKQVALYIRWVSGLAAVYTVYTKQPYAVFEQVRSALFEALEQGMMQKGKGACRPDMGTHLVKNNLFVYLTGKESPEQILETMQEFIRQNPGQFVKDSGRTALRYRRYYGLIKELLDQIGRAHV